MSIIEQLNAYKPLNQQEITEFVTLLLSNEDEDVKATYLQKFSDKPITQEELTYLTRSLIKTTYDPQPYIPKGMCICGTGGDKSNSFNISTTVSFVVACAEIPVIKHGNKGITSSSGSTDLLKAMSIKTSKVKEVSKQIEAHHLAFLSATETFPIMKRLQSVRKLINSPTIFNITGPLINPFNLDYQMMGVYQARYLPQIAQTLKDLGRRRAIVVHGAGGMDEATLAGENIVYEISENDVLRSYTVKAEEVGLEPASNSELIGGTPEENRLISESILKGEEQSAKLDVVLLNAALALYVAEKVPTIIEGVNLARKIIFEGKAYEKYLQLKGKSYDYIR
ncbi:anthranilate phosphoribosyltransferase [Staphylococcus sp. SQ8-PEA]|uniref:Anthranilate phosphoribosyltransferase n=1 Tax=Staphylococcus marylandisciuri TaxID=2981529 RepID=A0ABT2QNN7_9STAP|nr:anthranilate phosphoribosyltransferase [Staphylococcus marylandisciuri]MCU5745565.1 anthranilate phosphoribosyltransferase [Staphylococcus marylandisciuri]